jgi:hypothetical protein
MFIPSLEGNAFVSRACLTTYQMQMQIQEKQSPCLKHISPPSSHHLYILDKAACTKAIVAEL